MPRTIAPVLLAVLSVLAASLVDAVAQDGEPRALVMSGRVVQMADGTYGLLSGSRCASLPEELLPQLAPYLNQCVKITCALGDVPSGGWSCGPGPILAFEKIEVVQPPLDIVVAPAKATYQLDEPVVVNVTITNQSQEAQILELSRGATVLCQDYRYRLRLEPLGQLYDQTPYDLPPANGTRMIEPGEVVTFTVTSVYMVEPGEYQLFFQVGYHLFPSEVTVITVAPPADHEAHHAALVKWLAVAQPRQSRAIATELIEEFDDHRGVEVVLGYLTNTSWQRTLPEPLWGCQFAWQYGGQRGADIMIAKIQSFRGSTWIRSALDYGIARSPHCRDSLVTLLGCNELVRHSPSDWGQSIRVADVVAHWLAAHCDDVTFPTDGEQDTRDEAIASLIARLEGSPTDFTILSDSDAISPADASEINGTPTPPADD